MLLQNLAGGGNEELTSIKRLLVKPCWTKEEYRVLKEFMRITPEEEAEVLSSVDLESLLAGLGYHFPARATNPQIKCFLHPDNTPSLTLYRINSRSRFPNTCYCFGCHRSLNPIKVMVQLYGQSYPDAIDYLLGICLGSPRQLLRRRIMARFKGRLNQGDRGKKLEHSLTEPEPAGLPAIPLAIPLPSRERPVKGVTGEPGRDDGSWDRDKSFSVPAAGDSEVQAVLEAAVSFYHLQLKTFPQGLDYLSSRGLSATTVEQARLGFSCGLGLAHWLKEHGLNLDVAREIGLLYQGTKEWLAGRIVLPSLPVSPYGSPGKARPVNFLTGRLLPGLSGETGLLCNAFRLRPGILSPVSEPGAAENGRDEPKPDLPSENGYPYRPKYLSLKMARPTATLLDRFLNELQHSSYLHFNRTTAPTFEASESQPDSNLLRPYLLLVEGPFDSLLAWQWGYQAICCYGTSPGYTALEKLKAALETDLLQKALVCFDADPTRQALDGTFSQGAGPKAAGETLKFLATPKAQLLSLPPGFKDVASLGEVENGRTLLAGAFDRAAPDLTPILIPERR